MARYDIAQNAYDVGNAGFAIVAARFNHIVVDRLLDGALATLSRHQVQQRQIVVARVPGAFELALAALKLGSRTEIQAVITLGCIIRGDTPHFDYISAESARGVSQTALQLAKPVIFGVLTTDDQAQADARAGGVHGNKGEEAALAALEMVSLLRAIGS